jgi:hypothetical protein
MTLPPLDWGMRRRTALALIGTTVATSLAGCPGLGNSGDGETPTETPDGGTPTPTEPDPTPTQTPTVPAATVNGSFEDGWTGWAVGRDLPADPNYETERPVASEAAISTRAATDGIAACRLFIDGSQDDGTVWVQQPVDLTGYTHLAVDYRVSDSFNEIRKPAVYAGPQPDEGLEEADFDTSKSLEGHDAPGWKTFTYDVQHDGPGLLAVGFSIVWETGADAFLDNARLSADPPETVTPEATPTDAPADIESS